MFPKEKKSMIKIIILKRFTEPELVTTYKPLLVAILTKFFCENKIMHSSPENHKIASG